MSNLLQEHNILNETWNKEWVLQGCHTVFLTDVPASKRNHEPKNLAEWSEIALNKLFQQDLASEDLPTIKLEKKLVKANSLLPMQNRIRINKSLSDQITNKWDSLEGCLTKTSLNTKSGPFPILTCVEKYIIDGHHRWAQFLLTNPTAVIEILNVSCYRGGGRVTQLQEFLYSFDETLRAYLVENKHIEVISTEDYEKREQEKNSHRMNYEQVEEFITNHITKECVDLLYENKKINNNSKQEALKYFLNNLNYFITFAN